MRVVMIMVVRHHVQPHMFNLDCGFPNAKLIAHHVMRRLQRGRVKRRIIHHQMATHCIKPRGDGPDMQIMHGFYPVRAIKRRSNNVKSTSGGVPSIKI